jgi:hypothetical protein
LRRDRHPCRIIGSYLLASRLLLEFIEQAIKILAIKNDAGSLSHGHQLWAPYLVKSAALDAHIHDCFLMS